jgi:hypothetical protein
MVILSLLLDALTVPNPSPLSIHTGITVLRLPGFEAISVPMLKLSRRREDLYMLLAKAKKQKSLEVQIGYVLRCARHRHWCFD